MQLTRRFGRQATRTVATGAVIATALLAAACSSDTTGGAGPVIPGTPAPNPQITRAAFLADVDVRSRTVTIRAPQLNGTQNGLGAIRGSDLDASLDNVDLSLVGGDVVQITTSNFAASIVGQYQPGKVRVTFDVNLTNRLGGVQLVGPTVFPAPPAGTTGPILFPYDISVAVTSGGTGTGGQGNDVIVTLPSYGLVSPSTDWNGAPHSFFNDVSCTATGNVTDCFRWEEFAGPIFPGATTGASQVGFDLDPTVGQFTARLIVAADLQNSGPAPTGTIAGTVSSSAYITASNPTGLLNGVTIQAVQGPNAPTATTAGGTTASPLGAYSISAVGVGTWNVSVLSGLPAGCSAAAQNGKTVTQNNTTTVNFVANCPIPTNSITGQVTFSGYTPSSSVIDAFTISATPTGGSAIAGNVDVAGNYTIPGIPVIPSSGALTLTRPAGPFSDGLPNNGECAAPAAGSYSAVPSTVNFVVSCTAPAVGYQYNVAYVDNGATVTYTVTVDMSTYDDPAVPNANEQMGVMDGNISYNSVRLTGGSCSYGTVLGSPVAPNISGGKIIFSGTNTNAATGFTAFTVLTCTFNDGGSGSLATTSNITLAFDSSANYDFLPKLVINDVP